MAIPPQLILVWAGVAEKLFSVLSRLKWWGKKKKKEDAAPAP